MKRIIKPKIFIMAVLIFLISLVLAYLFISGNQAEKIVLEFKNETELSVNKSDGNLSAFGLFKSNLISCMILSLLGFIPFIYLGYFGSIMNGIMIGILMRLSDIKGMGVFELLLKGILPHGIFELIASMIVISMSVYLCNQMTKKILKKKNFNIHEYLKIVGIVYLKIIIPLLAIAGVIEAYMTPYLIGI